MLDLLPLLPLVATWLITVAGTLLWFPLVMGDRGDAPHHR
jgi:hypothetical protein